MPRLWALRTGNSWQGVNAWVRVIAARTGDIEPPIFPETKQGRARAFIWIAGAPTDRNLCDLDDW